MQHMMPLEKIYASTENFDFIAILSGILLKIFLGGLLHLKKNLQAYYAN